MVCCGGHGRVVADAGLAAGYERVAFIDDAVQDVDEPFEIVGRISDIQRLSPEWPDMIVGIGNNDARVALGRAVVGCGARHVSIVHPAATVSRGAQIGAGVFIAAGAVVNIGAIVGDTAIINTAASVDHDCRIGEGVHVSPGARLAGNVHVGDRSWIGIGASIKDRVRIGSNAIIGVGAAVVSDVPDDVTYVGVPARPMRGAK